VCELARFSGVPGLWRVMEKLLSPYFRVVYLQENKKKAEAEGNNPGMGGCKFFTFSL